MRAEVIFLLRRVSINTPVEGVEEMHLHLNIPEEEGAEIPALGHLNNALLNFNGSTRKLSGNRSVKKMSKKGLKLMKKKLKKPTILMSAEMIFRNSYKTTETHDSFLRMKTISNG